MGKDTVIIKYFFVMYNRLYLYNDLCIEQKVVILVLEIVFDFKI